MTNEASTSNSLSEDDLTSENKSNVESAETSEAFNYDDILEHLGQMGKFQLRTFLLLCLPAFFPGIVIMSYTFTGGVPKYR